MELLFREIRSIEDINELGPMSTIVKRNAKWSRASFGYYLNEDVLGERRRFSQPHLIGEIAEQCNRFLRLGDFALI